MELHSLHTRNVLLILPFLRRHEHVTPRSNCVGVLAPKYVMVMLLEQWNTRRQAHGTPLRRRHKRPTIRQTLDR